MSKKNLNVRWLYLAAGVLALLFAGIIYGWSILKAPLAADFGWTADQLALNFTLTMCFFCLGGMAGGLLSKRIGSPDPGGRAVLPGLFSHRPAGRRERGHAVRQLWRAGGAGHRHRL